jgi:tetrahydromethanopterin S-methyltransferase subunit C
MTNTLRNGQADTLSDRSTADLVKLAAEQISTLVRDELRLAQAELAEKGRHAGLGAGLFGGGGLVAAYGVGALVATLVLALSLVMPAWLATLIAAVLLFAVAAVLALIGRSQVKQAVPPVPQDTVRSVKADIETVSGAVRGGERGGQ